MYRGKRIDGKGWVKGGYCKFYVEYEWDGQGESVGIDTPRLAHFIFKIDATHEEVHPDSVSMSTGLKDKNGKGEEVYGSDIIGSPNGIRYEVYWSDTAAQWRVRFWNTRFKGKDEMSLRTALKNHYSKIRGNTTDNPTLLEGESNE